MPGIHLVKQVEQDLSLVNVPVIRINLDEWLHGLLRCLGDSNSIDRLENFKKWISIDDTLVDLLIVLLKLGEHSVDLFTYFVFETLVRDCIDEGTNLFPQLTV